MKEAALRAVLFAHIANARIPTESKTGARQIGKNGRKRLVFEDKTAAALLFVAFTKKFLRQSTPIHFVIDHRLGLIPDAPAASDEPLGKFDIFGNPGTTGAQTLVKQTDVRKDFPSDGHVGAGQRF